MGARGESNELTLLDLVVAVHEAAASRREALAALDDLLSSRRVRFKRPFVAARRFGGRSAAES